MSSYPLPPLPPLPPHVAMLPNPLLYIALHPDLQKLSPAQAQKHYMEYGIKEKRATTIKKLYPDFRADMYLQLNADIPKGHNEYDAQLHWLVKGRFENRCYKPTMDKEFIYLYTTDTHKARCTRFSAILDQLQIAYVVTSKCSSVKSNLYVLFTTENIAEFPFYYILNLENEACTSDLLEKYSLAKLESAPAIKDIQQCLVASEFLDVSALPTPTTKLKPRTTHVMVQQTPLTTATSDQTFYIPKIIHNKLEYVSDALTLKHIINIAKQQNMPFVCIANKVSPMLSTQILSKVLDFIEKHDDWDLCIITHDTDKPPPELLEIIQLDPHTKLLRCTRMMNGKFCIYNNKVYDNVLQWNYHNSQQGNTIDTYLGTQHLNVLTISV
jgi:hypothetical protein